MAGYLQVFNNAATVTVDDSSPTLGLRAKATANIPAGSGVVRVASVDFANCDVPVFAFRPNSPNRIARLYNIQTISATVRRVHVMTGRVWDPESEEPPPVNTAALGVTIYHFDRATLGGANYGLQVFDAASKLTFDSFQKPALVHAHYSPGFSYGSWTMPAGRIGAAIAALYHRYQIIDQLSQAYERERGGFFYVNGNVHGYDPDALFIQNVVAGGLGSIDRVSGRQSVTLVDVTNY